MIKSLQAAEIVKLDPQYMSIVCGIIVFGVFLVAQEVQPVGSPAVHRIRLYDELEQVCLLLPSILRDSACSNYSYVLVSSAVQSS